MDLSESPSLEHSSNRHPWEVSRLRFVASLVDRYVALDRPEVRVFDVGCGDAYVARELTARNPTLQVEGVDPALPVEKHGSRLTGRIRLWRELPGLEPGDSKARAVLMLDVLEHIEDDLAALRALAASPALDPDCILIVTVPAHQALFCSHDRLLGHYRRYSRKRLRSTLEQNGFSVLEEGGLYFSGFILRCIRAFLEQESLIPPLRETEVSTWDGGERASRFIAAVLSIEITVLRGLAGIGIRFPGSSCYAVARKNPEWNESR